MADQGTAAAVGDTGPAASRRLACLPCSRAKMRCDLNVPCSRCFKLCLSCLHIVPKPRNPAKGANDSAAGRAKGYRRGRRRRGAETPALDATPIVELCIARSDPGVIADIFLESFYRELATGRILRGSVVALMRTWRLWNLAAGTDLSWGAFDAMSTALGIMPVEVEGPEEVVYDVPHAERQRRAKMFMMGLRSAAGGPLSEVAEGLPYSHSDEVVPTLVTVFKAYPTEGEDGGDASFGQQAPPTEAGGEGGAVAGAEAGNPSPPWTAASVAHALSRFRQWSNPACAHMVKGVAEIQGDLLRHRALQFYIVMALFDPEDRAVLADHYHKVFFTDTPQTTSFVKASLSDGRVRLYIQRCRRIRLSGGRVAIVHQIELCPKSRHITQKPDVSHAVLRKFRSSKTEEAEADDDEGYDGPVPPPAAAITWAEGNQLAAARAVAVNASAVPVAFPALAGVPATPALGKDVEQVALQALEWRAAAVAAGEEAGGSVPEIFRRLPLPPPSPLGQDSQKGGRRPVGGGGGHYGGGVASTVSGGGVGRGTGMGMDAGGLPVQLHGCGVAPDVFSHFSPAPESLPTSPPPLPTFGLDPQGDGSFVPVFGVGAEQLQKALFGDEDDQGGGIIYEEGQGTWEGTWEGESGGGEVGVGQVEAVGFDPTATELSPNPPRPS